MRYKIISTGLSDKGLVRENNEDFWAQLPQIHFYALADGMGGHQAGEVASHEAIRVLCSHIKTTLAGKKGVVAQDIQLALRHAIEEANSAVYEKGFSNEKFAGMGTTLCCIQFMSQKAIYAHVGDSRIYRFRKGKLQLLTSDHSLLKELMDLGQLGQYQIAEFLYKNILTRAVGTEPAVEPSIAECDIQEDDVFMMCTDGLSDLLFLEEIEAIIQKTPAIQDAIQNLIAAAKEKGGYDNITAVMMKIQRA